ncbi:MAG: Ig-like domain-containing protein, partial [Bacteroidota bacterium]
MKHFLLLFITLICVNSAMGIVAVSDTVYVEEDAPAFSGDLSLNDTIAEGLTAWYNIISQTPEYFGSISLNSTGSFTFNLASNVNGEKKYLYSVCTAPGGDVCDLAELVIIVSSVNDAPTFQISARQVC